MNGFSDQLKARQNGEPDGVFAARLGISRAHWTKVRLGKRGPGIVLIRAAITLWPELRPIYLNDRAAELDDGAA